MNNGSTYLHSPCAVTFCSNPFSEWNKLTMVIRGTCGAGTFNAMRRELKKYDAKFIRPRIVRENSNTSITE